MCIPSELRCTAFDSMMLPDPCVVGLGLMFTWGNGPLHSWVACRQSPCSADYCCLAVVWLALAPLVTLALSAVVT